MACKKKFGPWKCMPSIKAGTTFTDDCGQEYVCIGSYAGKGDTRKGKIVLKNLAKLVIGLSPAYAVMTIGGLLLWSVSWKVVTGVVLMFWGFSTTLELFRYLGLFSKDGRQ